jgi:hypothetical protein
MISSGCVALQVLRPPNVLKDSGVGRDGPPGPSEACPAVAPWLSKMSKLEEQRKRALPLKATQSARSRGLGLVAAALGVCHPMLPDDPTAAPCSREFKREVTIVLES